MERQKWRGIVKGGAIVLDEPIPLPDGTPVIILPEGEQPREPDWGNDPFLKVEEWAVSTGMPNLARDFERLLYGIGEGEEEDD